MPTGKQCQGERLRRERVRRRNAHARLVFAENVFKAPVTHLDGDERNVRIRVVGMDFEGLVEMLPRRLEALVESIPAFFRDGTCPAAATVRPRPEDARLALHHLPEPGVDLRSLGAQSRLQFPPVSPAD